MTVPAPRPCHRCKAKATAHIRATVESGGYRDKAGDWDMCAACFEAFIAWTEEVKTCDA